MRSSLYYFTKKNETRRTGMEQAEDGIGSQSEGDGLLEEPGEGEDEVLGVFVKESSLKVGSTGVRWSETLQDDDSP